MNASNSNNSNNQVSQLNASKNLQAKDLINIGIFTALYIVAFFLTGMIGYMPLFLLAIPVLCPLVAGVVFMLFLTKVNKFGMITIMGIIVALFMFITGHPWPVIPTGIVCAFLADLIIKSGNYRDWKKIVLGYIVFSEMVIGLIVPWFFMRSAYIETIRSSLGDAYAETVISITPAWVFPVLIVLIAVGATIGSYIGRGILKKHFKRAGIA